MISFYLGGARSGKSRRALEQAAGGIFVATAQFVDVEFEKRIEKHQAERGEQWSTIECPIHLAKVVEQHNQSGNVIVLDCLTVWLGNLMHHEQDIAAHTKQLLDVLKVCVADVYLVSNEVGQGVVPEHPMGREFRDLQGRLNQQVAEIADTVELLVAGIPLTIKS